MSFRARILLLCAVLTLLSAAASAEAPALSPARQRVIDYAMQVHNYEWTLPEEEGVILLYNRNYRTRTNGFRLLFDITPPYVVYGTVRGVPYTLSSYGNGRETIYPEYLALTTQEKARLANIYMYTGHGKRLSMKYGMSCATFLSDCVRQGLEDELPVMNGVVSLMSDPIWKKHFTFGKHGWKDYADLQPGDFLSRDGHAVLVIENEPDTNTFWIMEQTPPDYAIEHCENMTDVTVTITYRDHPTKIQAKRLCMECAACRQATTGTQYRQATYEEFSEGDFIAVFVDYDEE